jgi:hypothetical protein
MRWKSYIGAIAAILGLRFLDLYVTYRYTPDLKVEWNPLISLFGASWPGLILTQIAIVAFIAVQMSVACQDLHHANQRKETPGFQRVFVHGDNSDHQLFCDCP